MHGLATLETEYRAAKLRLQSAQQEKLEAAAEFLSARAALRQTMETLWPSPGDCGGELEASSRSLDVDSIFGYDETAILDLRRKLR